MFLIFWLFAVCALGHANAQGQRVAPGVPPQHYQQPHGGQQMHQQIPQQMHQQQIPQQQMHQQQQYQQQVPVQQAQIPPQQHQQHQQHHEQQVPVQHVPIQQAAPHGHDHGHHPQQVLNLNTANIAHERDHIAEHASVPMDTSKMSDQELQFHYFKMHDADNNNKLDGCELIKSLIHWHEQGNADPNASEAVQKVFSDDEFCNLIDPILQMDDLNKDGFIDYPEFIQAQHKAAAASPTP